MNRLKEGIGWTSLFLAILTVTIFLTINSAWLYWITLRTTTVLADVGLSMHQMMVNYWHLLAYLELPWVNTLQMPDFTDSVSALKHFEEVKNWFLVSNLVMVVTVVPAVRFVQRVRRQHQQWRFIRPFSVGALVPVLLGLLMAINFDQFFIAFHTLLFHNSDWLFDPQVDTIILALPESFFLQCFILAVGLFEAAMLVGIWRGRVALRRL